MQFVNCITYSQFDTIFYDNFHDNSNNWGIENSKKAFVGFRNNVYLFNNLTSLERLYISRNIELYETKDFSFEIELVRRSGVIVNSGYGLSWGIKDNSHMFAFLIHTNSKYCIQKTDVQLTNIVERTFSPYINKGNNVSNILRITKEKNKLYFYINGNKVYEIDSEPFFGNGFGVIADADLNLEIESFFLGQPVSKERLEKQIEILSDKVEMNNKNVIIPENIRPGSNNKISLNKVWEKSYGTSSEEVSYSLIETNDGNFLLCGARTYQSGLIMAALGVYMKYPQPYLVKIDTSGNILWERVFENESFVPLSLIQKKNGDIILTGIVEIGYAMDSYIFHLSADGEIIWSTHFTGSSVEIYDIIATNDEGFVVTGSRRGREGKGNDVFLAKYDENDNKIWGYFLPEKNNGGLLSVAQTSDSGFICAGYTKLDGFDNKDACIYKFDKNGVLIWNKTFGGNGDDAFLSVKKTGNEEFIACGYTIRSGKKEDVYLVKLNIDGKIIWERNYGDEKYEFGSAFQNDGDNGCIVVGYKEKNLISKDSYVLMIDKNGNKLWESTFGGGQDEEAHDIIKTRNGEFLITGWTDSFSISAGKKDFYLLRLSYNADLEILK